MLDFRSIDYSADVPEIVDLIRKSLSDNHTVSNFLWKHYENPFGKSFGLLAVDNKKIVGVRMFMRWEFKRKDIVVKAIRPVDTITHPDYRGQGIFKKLTLEGLKINEGEYHIIFNTPNENSLPGYLKMGWNIYEKPLNYYVSLIIPSRKNANYISLIDKEEINFTSFKIPDSGFFKTNLTKKFLGWRYKSNEYTFALFKPNEANALLIYRLQSVKGLKTLILVDFVGPDNLLKGAINGLSLKLKVFLVYHLEKNKLYKINIQSGKSIVVHKNDERDIQANLNFSLADLEGRL